MDPVRDGVDEVRLAEPGAAADEERIVAPPADAIAAACASWFDGPTTKFAKVCFGFMPVGAGAVRGVGSMADAEGGTELRNEMGRGRTEGAGGRSQTGRLNSGSSVHATCTDQPVMSRIVWVSVGTK
jgi:hypothetical protein